MNWVFLIIRKQGMEPFLLNTIPANLDVRKIAQMAHLGEYPLLLDDLEQLIQDAGQVARPKAVYRLSAIDSRDDESVMVDGVELRSRVLRVNLDKTHRVFPYVATCGRELEEWSKTIDDPMQRFLADKIKEAALFSAAEAIAKHMKQRFRDQKFSLMSPGSLPDRPIEQQRPLFRIIGDARKAIGVDLSESYLMLPTKSISGLRFSTEEDFFSCQLCPREPCPNRRAVFEPGLMAEKYHPPSAE